MWLLLSYGKIKAKRPISNFMGTVFYCKWSVINRGWPQLLLIHRQNSWEKGRAKALGWQPVILQHKRLLWELFLPDPSSQCFCSVAPNFVPSHLCHARVIGMCSNSNFRLFPKAPSWISSSEVKQWCNCTVGDILSLHVLQCHLRNIYAVYTKSHLKEPI